MGLRLAAIAAVLACASVAAAAPPLVGVAVDGAPSPEFAAALAGSAAKAAGDGVKPVPTCVTAACADTVLRQRGASEGVIVTVAVTGEFHDQFAIRATLVDSAGRNLRRRADDCGTCAIGEATAMIAGLVGQLLEADDHDAVDVAVTAPRPIELTIDGAAAGSTPWVGKLLAGPHVFEVAGERREVFVESNGESVRVSLGESETPGGGRGHHPRRRSILPFVAGGVGLVLIGTGAYLVSIDGDPTCAHPGCPEERATAAGGWTTIGLGVLGLGAAGYLYWRDRQASAPPVMLVPTSDGAAAVAVGRF